MNNNEYDKAKSNIASNLGIDLKSDYNGDLKCKDAGRIGGVIGGNMVREMIKFAEEHMSEKR